jgi:hypothetical protein
MYVYMMQTARKAVAESEEDGTSHITACFDGSWRKLGHTSLNGIMSATYFDTGKVLNMEIMSHFCFVCHTNPTFEYDCKKN